MEYEACDLWVMEMPMLIILAFNTFFLVWIILVMLMMEMVMEIPIFIILGDGDGDIDVSQVPRLTWKSP